MLALKPLQGVCVTRPVEQCQFGSQVGPTLVDAQDELWAAWGRLEAAGRPERAERWMTEPPPWPPASIARMLQRGEEGGTLLETLTGVLRTLEDAGYKFVTLADAARAAS